MGKSGYIAFSRIETVFLLKERLFCNNMRKSSHFLIALAVLAADQVTKGIITSSFAVGESLRALSGLSFTYVQNTGALWSIMQDQNVFFTILSVAVLGTLLRFREQFRGPLDRIVLGLLLGGVAGNLVDRVLRGFVVDFIDLGWWPIFNIADSAISCGIALYLVSEWRRSKQL